MSVNWNDCRREEKRRGRDKEDGEMVVALRREEGKKKGREGMIDLHITNRTTVTERMYLPNKSLRALERLTKSKR